MLLNLNKIFEKYSVKCLGVIHCGAHLAEEKSIYDSLHINDVLWIEANPYLYDKIKNDTRLKNDIIINELLWENSEHELIFNIANNTESSSILDFGKHREYHPEIYYIDKIIKKGITLDDIFKKYNLNIKKYNLLCMDLQGVELRVLNGFKNNLNSIDYIYCEVNIEEVYLNCDKLKSVDIFLKKYGFIRVEQSEDPVELGKLLTYGDAFYIKRKKNVNI